MAAAIGALCDFIINYRLFQRNVKKFRSFKKRNRM